MEMVDATSARIKLVIMVQVLSKVLREGCVEGHLTDGAIVWLKYDEGTSVTLEVSQQSYRIVTELLGDRSAHCTVVDIRKVRETSAAARRARTHSSLRGIGLLVSSPVSRMLANAYLRVKRPEVPTRLFTCKDEARKWALARLRPDPHETDTA
jgi:hypothetical protein